MKAFLLFGIFFTYLTFVNANQQCTAYCVTISKAPELNSSGAYEILNSFAVEGRDSSSLVNQCYDHFMGKTMLLKTYSPFRLGYMGMALPGQYLTHSRYTLATKENICISADRVPLKQ